MENKILLTPRFNATLGDYSFTDGIEIECHSDTTQKSNWAIIELDEFYKNQVSFQALQPGIIKLGYGDDFETIMDGSIVMGKGAAWNQIKVVDDTYKLYETTFAATFLECLPQDIIKYGLAKAGITKFVLSGITYKQIKVFPVSKKNVVDLIKEVNRIWNIPAEFYFRDHVFYWGVESEQKFIYTLEEGVNVLKFTKFSNVCEVETIGVPWIHQGERVHIKHSKYEGITKVISSTIKRNREGYVRMVIEFKAGEKNE